MLELPLEAGAFDEDALAHQDNVRAAVVERSAQKSPIYPNRALGLEYAAISVGVPRGYPLAGVAISNLREGERFQLNGLRYRVVRMGKRAKFEVTHPDGRVTTFVTYPAAKNWAQFERDIDGLLLASAHGVDAGDLLCAWRRDPVSHFRVA